MTAAQKALQAQQWQEALKNLEEAETKSGLNASTKRPFTTSRLRRHQAQ